jgi:hypothetical protein
MIYVRTVCISQYYDDVQTVLDFAEALGLPQQNSSGSHVDGAANTLTSVLVKITSRPAVGIGVQCEKVRISERMSQLECLDANISNVFSLLDLNLLNHSITNLLAQPTTWPKQHQPHRTVHRRRAG